ncbi:response regulator, partial [Acinetobacter baumannii]
MSQETTPLTSSENSGASGPLVLVVDDLPDNVTLVRMMLERRGFRVATAQDGAEAVELARQLRPAI